jgi:hypothetical protein
MAQAKTLIATAAVLALIPAIASAQPAPYEVLNGQVQLGDAVAALNVQFQTSHGSAANNLSAGNTMSAKAVTNSMNVANSQVLRGTVSATNVVSGQMARGVTQSTAVAHGNAAQVEGCCATIGINSTQAAQAGTKITANSTINVGSADYIISGAQATANSFGSFTKNGYTQGKVTQTSAAKVDATSKVTACCNNGAISSNAIGAANSARWEGESATIFAEVDQKNTGAVTTTSSVDVKSATNVSSGAAAAGNLAEIQNKWGYAQLSGSQNNSGAVTSSSVVNLDNFNGFAMTGSNSVGNSALLSNLGSDVSMFMGQSNTGNVSATTSFTGSSANGGVGQATSSSVGNAITAYSCASCGNESVLVEGRTTQYNSGNVTATTNFNAGNMGMISASASAIGNSATFVAQRSGH